MTRVRWLPAAVLLATPSMLSAQDSGSLFRSRCMSCHVAPDVRFETDLAWLSQVKSTA